MDDLLRHIDELAGRGDRRWKRRGKQVRVQFASGGRSHVVHIARRKDRYVFSSVVADTDVTGEDRRSLARRIWRRNALKPVVTFIIDSRGRVVGRIEQPVESLRAREIEFYVEALARECDRFEYVLTGADTR